MPKSKKKSHKTEIKLLLALVVISLAVFFILLTKQLLNKDNKEKKGGNSDSGETEGETIVMDPFLESDAITVDLLPVNQYSRPGDELTTVNGIVIHYVGNPGTTAAQNRSYFNNLATDGSTYASSHYIVGLDGEIIQCVPLNEIAYASNERNADTISIECCHPDATGEFTQATYDSVVKLAAALCRTYNLQPETDIIRHYDITGKQCPKYFVDHEDEWQLFKISVKNEETAE